MRGFRPFIAVAGAASLLLIGPGVVHASNLSTPGTCTGTFTSPGFIAPGSYSSLKVTGVCAGPSTGTVSVSGDVTVAPGAWLLANYPSQGAQIPEGDGTFLVKEDITVGKGGVLLFGCEPAVGCVNTTTNAVRGNVDADGALGVILHHNIIGGNVSYIGGGGGVNCNAGFGPFSFGVYSDVEDDAIHGNLTVSGLHSCWFGQFRNVITGNDTVSDNRFADPDATEVANNAIFGNLSCSNNVPDAQFGDSVQPPNVVFGAIGGECKALSVH